MLVAIREVYAVNERALTLLPRPHITSSDTSTFLRFNEDASQVDGIGGVLWEGALLLNHVLASLPLSNTRMLELGTGTGLCGIYAASCGAQVTITDREVDLASSNALQNPVVVEVKPLLWSTDASSLPQLSQPVDIIIGAEIAVLNKQHAALVSTIHHYTSSNTLVLLSFDASPPPHHCTYATRFSYYMTQLHYHSEVVAHGAISWSEGIPEGIVLNDQVRAIKREHALLNKISSGIHFSTDNSEHHIMAFYPPSAAHTCSRCHVSYHPLLNSPASCRHHSGLFVCRYHPAEANCSINGLGDQLGYYCQGNEEWEAKFWDCCGAEDPSALGCITSEHVPYS